MAATPAETKWVRAPFGVFELRPGRPAVLHNGRGAFAYRGVPGHDYSVEEIRGWADLGEWHYITADEAAEWLKAKGPAT